MSRRCSARITWIARVVGCFATLFGAVQVFAQPPDRLRHASPMGWLIDPTFVEIEVQTRDNALHRQFVLKGESAERWSERVTITGAANREALSPTAIMDKLADDERRRCQDFDDHRIEMPVQERQTMSLALWHCPKGDRPDRGEVRSIKLVVNDGHHYAMIVEGDYPAYEKASTPLRREQMERWIAMQRSFVPCRSYVIPGCQPDADLIGKALPMKLEGEEAAAVKRIEARAHAIFVQDQMAWHATDFAMHEKLLRKKGGGGFLAVPAATGGGAVYFFRDRRSGQPTGQRVDIAADGTLSTGPKKAVLEGEALGRHVALKAAVARTDLSLCSGNANTIVLPNDDGDGWIVYVLTASVEQGIGFIGGHNRLSVAPDGTVRTVDHSARSCLHIDANARGPAGEHLAAHLVSHLVSHMPWETHVFQALTLNISMIVLTESAVWRIEGGRMSKLDLGSSPADSRGADPTARD